MTVLLITTHLNAGGITRYLLNLCKQLVSRHTVWLASSGGAWQELFRDIGVLLYLIPINTKSIASTKILFSFWNLLVLLKREKIELLHANTRVTEYLSFLLSRWAGIPYVVTFHGFYRNTFFRKLFVCAGDHSIAVSKAVKDHICNDFNIPHGQVTVVYNGIDVSDFSPSKIHSLKRSFENKDILIGLLGRISREKGHFLAVDAVSLLRKKEIPLQLVFSGQGKLKLALREYIEAKQISFVRFLSSSAADFLETVDLVIIPSSKEGFGYTVLEAFAKEKIVIAFATGGIKEIITHNHDGFLFFEYTAVSLAHCIGEVLARRKEWPRIINNAKKTLARFSLSTMAQKTESVYQAVVRHSSIKYKSKQRDGVV